MNTEHNNVTPSTILLHPRDNVRIALTDLVAGTVLSELQLTLKTDIARGHKIAVADIARQHNVIRYGQVIGQATQAISAGTHVHTHNLGMASNTHKYQAGGANSPLEPISHRRTFAGFHRPDGRVGTRNYVGIVTSVNCSGSVARFIAEAARETGLLDAFPNVDGIVPIVHGTGCGMAGQGEGYDTLFRTLSGYARHPNFGGVLLLGLGCEVMQVRDLAGGQPVSRNGAFRYMTIQSSGGTQKTVERGLAALRDILETANRATRAPADIGEIMVGMQCGGSDGYSGITANPALGYASDLLVRHGGTSILSETSEIYGAEHLLAQRAENSRIADKLIARVKWWEDYTSRHGGEMDNNPSPGNKRGGLTTILEKSLGAVAKGGTAPLSGVYKYGEPIDRKGFVFMDSPGFDPCSVTGQVASGANLIVFTTGRGSVSGYQPTPCIKLATNSEMYTRLSRDMDMNCGDIVSEGRSVAEKGAALLELMIAVASGRKTRSEESGFGGVEFVPWQLGAVM